MRGDGDHAYSTHQVERQVCFSPGVVRTKRADCFSTVVNVHSSGYVMRLADELDFSDYDVSYSDELDMWVVTRGAVAGLIATTFPPKVDMRSMFWLRV